MVVGRVRRSRAENFAGSMGERPEGEGVGGR